MTIIIDPYGFEKVRSIGMDGGSEEVKFISLTW